MRRVKELPKQIGRCLIASDLIFRETPSGVARNGAAPFVFVNFRGVYPWRQQAHLHEKGGYGKISS